MTKIDERLAKMTPLQRAMFALKETQDRLDALEHRLAEPIAIVGMACRFPGAVNDADAYWRLLCDGVDAIQEVPPERWDAAAYYDPDPRAPGKMNSRWGGFVRGVEDFDNHFFGISDREAMRIDPQHRLLLELAWEALEDAGLPPGRLRGSRTGVFIGLSHSEYGIMLSSDLAQTDAYVGSGTAHCIAANRISFVFDFSGPSVALDTACSSSLVTVHLACQSLHGGECELAVAGGVNIILSPLGTINLTKAGFCAPDGRVRAFDAAASGYVRGEGAGLVVLKPLSAALRDHDRVYAVIRGSAVNQNGASNGLTAPSRQAQTRVLRHAYAAAKLSPAEVQYVETQGTGTRLGDAIEASALGEVVGRERPADNVCAIGSVKTNLGHLEAASGVASLMKVALALRHQKLPPTLHFHTPNPEIPFADLRLSVQQKLEPWPQAARRRVAGVSAFGFGGSNAHVVLEEPPAPSPAPPAATESDADVIRILPLSARTETALKHLAREYVAWLRDTSTAWQDICFTAASRRDHHDCRLAVSAASPAQAAAILEAYLNGTATPELRVGRRPYGRDLKVAFAYGPGIEFGRDGLAALGRMAARLAGALEDVDAALQRLAGWTLTSALADAAAWQDPIRAFPATVALQLALTAWWRRAGVAPQVVLGHGIGELAAACAAGVLTADEALAIAVACGRGDETAAPSGLAVREACLPFVSTADDPSQNGRPWDVVRWRRSLQATPALDAAIGRLRQRQADVCLEIGPASLCEMLKQGLKQEPGIAIAASLGGCGEREPLVREAVATLYAAGADLRWEQILEAGGRCVRVPTYPWQRQRLWLKPKDWLAKKTPDTAEAGAAEAPAPTGTQPAPEMAGGQAEVEQIRTRPDLNTPYVAPRTPLEETLARAWSEILRIDRVGMHDNFFELGGDSLQAMMLHNALQDQLGEVVHGYVLFQAQSVGELAAYMRSHFGAAILRLHPDEPGVDETQTPEPAPGLTVGDLEVAEVRRLVDTMAPIPPVSYPIQKKNPRVVFLLSPPRSGSTLFRVMLAGHDGLFAPPELELLSFNTIAEQKTAYTNVPGQWLEGMVRTVMEIQGEGVEQARRLIREWEESGTTVQEVYRWLQAPLGHRVLVDKTPSYSGRLQVMQRAEQLFEEPLYLHLLRHPCGMIRSYVDYNMHEAFRIRFKVSQPIPFTPQQIAELVWVISHQNILELLRDIPASRQYRVRFEDVVGRPAEAMRGVCGFLGLDYQEEMIYPYDHPEKKMVDGVVSQDRMHGDQKFLVKHKAIDPAVADAWRQHLTGDFLGPPARRLAAEFGYDDLPAPPSAAPTESESQSAPTAGLAKRTSQDGEAEELLQHLDELSDEEVTALLQEQMAEEAIHA